MSTIPRARWVLPVLLAALCLMLAGCATTLEYVPEGVDYTLDEVEDLAQSIPLGPVEDIATEDGTETRQQRLTELRGYGDTERALADALTSDFPVDPGAVPVYIEAGRVDGDVVWIIIEAWGEQGSTLVHRRLWVLDRTTYTVLTSSSFR
ncbi:MAG: hypothetical protein ACYC77_10565 [Coriobacteriia bacterium]